MDVADNLRIRDHQHRDLSPGDSVQTGQPGPREVTHPVAQILIVTNLEIKSKARWINLISTFHHYRAGHDQKAELGVVDVHPPSHHFITHENILNFISFLKTL